MEPPFVVGRIVEPPYFIDREREIDQLVNSLGSLSENQLVIALRRMGKSSLLRNVERAIRRSYPDTLTAYVDCRRVTSLRSFSDELVTEVLKAYEPEHPVRGWLKLKRRLFSSRIKDLLPEIEKVGGSVGNLFEVYIELRERAIDDEQFARSAFEFLEAFPEEYDTGLVVILDEFQELHEIASPLVFQLFKSFSDRLEKVRFAFSGSSVRVLDSIFLQPDSPLYHMAGKVPLEPLDEAIVLDFLRERFGEAGMAIDEDAARTIHELTGGIPFYVQKIGLNCWLTCLQDDRTSIDRNDVMAAHDTMLWELGAEFETRFEFKYGQAQKAILIELSGGEVVRRSDLADRTERSTGQLSSSLTGLENAMEIRKRGRGRYQICDAVFAAWIRMRIRGEER